MPEDYQESCDSCGEENTGGLCKEAERPCGHHCNHIWSHDKCCWCGFEAPVEDAE